MNTNEELLQQIRQLIAALETELGKLQQGSKAYNAKANAVTAFREALGMLNKDISASEQKLRNLLATMESVMAGKPGRYTVASKRIRTGTFASAVETTRPPLESFLEPADPFAGVRAEASGKPTLPPKPLDWDSLSKEEQAKIEKANQRTIKAIRKFTEDRARAIAEIDDANKKTKENLRKQIEKDAQADVDSMRSIIEAEDRQVASIRKQRAADQKRQAEEAEKARVEAIDASGMKPEDQLMRLGSEVPGDRFDEAIRGRRATNRAYEEVLRERIELARKEDAARRQYESVRDAEARAEREANRKMVAEINKREALIERQRKMQNLEASLPGGVKAAQTLDAKARAIDPNFTRDTIRKVSIEGSSQIAKINYEYTTAEGVFKRATFTVDKFGKVLEDVPRRLQGFGTQIARNIRESIAWGAAIGLVYGTMNQLNRIVEVAIKNQAALADIEVTLANATQSTNEIFSAAADIASRTGESLDGVIEAYNLAYRATGGMADANQRFVTTNKLLTDALVLSKLSTLNQAEAIDILSAALKQTGMNLDEGSLLLDKWVRVTKVANVDLTTLATGFAVLGDAAEAAGLDADKLNAVIATISEVSPSSGKEVANTARALVAGFQSDQARKELNLLGVSIEDAQGKTRGFLEIVEELRNLQKAGIIDSSQFSKLTLALGGGSRRQAAFSSFITNFDKIATIEQESLNASGDAAAALETKLVTVETAVTRLGSSFQELAQAVGESGGVLDTFTDVVNILNLVTKALTGVTDAAGKAGPILAAALAGVAYLNLTSGAKATMYNKLGNLGQRFGNMIQPPTQGLEGAPGGGALWAGRFQKYTPGVVGAGIGIATGVKNIAEGNAAQGVGNLIGTAAGTAIGAWAGGPGGAFVGATLGSAIGEGIVNAAQSFKPQFSQIFSDIFAPQPGTGNVPALTPQQKQEQAVVDELQDKLGIGLQNKSGLKGIDDFFRVGLKNVLSASLSLRYGSDFKGITDAQVLLFQLEIDKALGKIAQSEYDAIIDKIRKTKDAGAPTVKPLTPETEKALEDERKRREVELRGLLQGGEIGLAPFRQGMERLGGFTAAVQQYQPIVGDKFSSPEELTSMFSNITARGSDENLFELNAVKQEINDAMASIEQLNAEIASIPSGTEEYNNKLKERAALLVSVEDATTGLALRIRELNRQIEAQVQLLQEARLDDYELGKGVTLSDVESRARQIFTDELTRQVSAGQITQEQMQAIMETTQDSLLSIGKLVEVAENVPLSALQAAIKEFEEQEKLLKKSADDKVGYQFLDDITMEQFQSVINGPKYKALASQIKAKGGTVTEDPMVTITQNGISSDRKDWKIVQYLLQEILKTEQKQLDGMFNLPDGATFWIPFEAAKLMPGQDGGGMSDEWLADIAENTQSMADMMRKFREADAMYPVTPGTVAQPTTPAKPTITPAIVSTSDQIKKFRDWEERYSPVTSYKPEMRGRSYGQIGQKTLGDSLAPAANGILKGLQSVLGALASIPQILTSISPASIIDSLGIIDLLPERKPTTTSSNPQDLARSLSQTFSNLSTRLELRIDNRTVVQVDGKAMAMVVKQYLKNDLIRYNRGSASAGVAAV